MILLAGGASGPKRAELFASVPCECGSLYGPSNWATPWTEHWAADNDCYAHRFDHGWWEREGERAWLKMLDKIAAHHTRPLFAILPDVPFHWALTLERAVRYRHELDAREIPPAIALQDSAERGDWADAAALDTPAVFIGGSTRWKWLNVESVRERFWDEWVHVGRVNGPRQIRECLRVGVDSVDGTGWARFSRKMMPKLVQSLTGTYQAANLRMDI